VLFLYKSNVSGAIGLVSQQTIAKFIIYYTIKECLWVSLSQVPKK